MKLFFIFLLLTFCSVSFSSVPTIEGLFRNGINKEIDGNLIVLKFKITKKYFEIIAENEMNEEVKSSREVDNLTTSKVLSISEIEKKMLLKSENISQKLQKKEDVHNYVKLIFLLNPKTPKHIQLIQLVYRNPNYSAGSLESIDVYNDFLREIQDPCSTP